MALLRWLDLLGGLKVRVRYELMTFLDKMRGIHPKRCVFCGRKLTDIEVKYYENSCDKCEEKNMRIWERE